jgi:hypothetical protein
MDDDDDVDLTVLGVRVRRHGHRSLRIDNFWLAHVDKTDSHLRVRAYFNLIHFERNQNSIRFAIKPLVDCSSSSSLSSSSLSTSSSLIHVHVSARFIYFCMHPYFVDVTLYANRGFQINMLAHLVSVYYCPRVRFAHCRLLPFAVVQRNTDSSVSGFVGPVLFRVDNATTRGRSFVASPLFVVMSSAHDRRRLVVLNVGIWHESCGDDDSFRFVLFPILWCQRTATLDSVAVWPLFSVARRYGNGDDGGARRLQSTRATVLWPMLSVESSLIVDEQRAREFEVGRVPEFDVPPALERFGSGRWRRHDVWAPFPLAFARCERRELRGGGAAPLLLRRIMVAPLFFAERQAERHLDAFAVTLPVAFFNFVKHDPFTGKTVRAWGLAPLRLHVSVETGDPNDHDDVAVAARRSIGLDMYSPFLARAWATMADGARLDVRAALPLLCEVKFSAIGGPMLRYVVVGPLYARFSLDAMYVACSSPALPLYAELSVPGIALISWRWPALVVDIDDDDGDFEQLHGRVVWPVYCDVRLSTASTHCTLRWLFGCGALRFDNNVGSTDDADDVGDARGHHIEFALFPMYARHRHWYSAAELRALDAQGDFAGDDPSDSDDMSETYHLAYPLARYHRSPTARSLRIAPFLYWRRTRHALLLVAFPIGIVAHRERSHRSFACAPLLVYFARDPACDYWTLQTPLFGAERRGAARRYSVAWPLAVLSSASDSSSLRILGVPVASVVAGQSLNVLGGAVASIGADSGSVGPLLHYDRSRQGALQLSILWLWRPRYSILNVDVDTDSRSQRHRFWPWCALRIEGARVRSLSALWMFRPSVALLRYESSESVSRVSVLHRRALSVGVSSASVHVEMAPLLSASINRATSSIESLSLLGGLIAYRRNIGFNFLFGFL